MLRHLSHLILLACVPLLFTAWTTTAKAQPKEQEKAAWRKALAKAEEEYRIYFKKPATPLEYWAAISFEFDVGKYDVAAVHLKKLLALPKDQTDAELLKVEAIKGLSQFLQMRGIARWFDNDTLNQEAKDNAEILIDRMSKALEKKLSDPVRIRRLIDGLNAPTPEERAYAFDQLKRTKDRAAPYLVDELRALTGKVEQERLKRIILELDESVMIPFLETLKASVPADYADVDVRLPMLELFRKKRDKRAIPYLWHMSQSEKYPLVIRTEAKRTLAILLGVHEQRIPDARAELTKLAKRYAEHRVPYRDVVRPIPKKGEPLSADFAVKFRPWDGKKLAVKPELKPSLTADYFFGMRHLREALDLDPTYKPAQKVMVKAILENRFADKLNQFIIQPLPKEYQSLLAQLDPNLLIDVLEQGMNGRDLAVMLPLVRILGARGEARAARTSNVGTARGLVRALYYPDPRAQREAMAAVLALPGKQRAVVTARIVEILRRFVATKDEAQLLAIHVPENEKLNMRKAIEAAGFVPVFAKDRKEAFAALHQSASIDTVLIHPTYPLFELPYLLSNLRHDADAGQMPVLVMAPLNEHDSIRRLTYQYANIFPTLDTITVVPAELKAVVEESVIVSKAPKYIATLDAGQKQRFLEQLRKTKGAMISSPERKMLADEALFILALMSDGQIKGFNIEPAKDAIYTATMSKDAKRAEKAVRIYGRFAGTDVQNRLSGIAVDASRDKAVRLAAAESLNSHVNKYGLFLNRFQIEDLRQVFVNPKMDEDLRRQMAILMGNLPRAKSDTGVQLRRFPR